MGWRVITGVIVAALALATGIGAASFPPQIDQLVEGHTVFTVLKGECVNCTGTSPKAAAVAVLIRQASFTSVSTRFPAVLWFNDQYLVDPLESSGSSATFRYPCTGAVLVTNQADPGGDPRAFGLGAYNANTYVTSYFITDPNENHWIVDKWSLPYTTGFASGNETVWTVALGGNQPGSSTPDDGQCDTAPYTDSAKASPAGGSGTSASPPANSPYNANPPATYPCGPTAQLSPAMTCARSLQYNAVLYFEFNDLTVAGVAKNHTAGSYDSTHDGSACDAASSNDGVGDGKADPSVPLPGQWEHWPCPGGDSNRQGNSHPFNPAPGTDPFAQGRTSHGYSADCTGDGTFDLYCHATAEVDIYYGIAPTPIQRFYSVFDVEGSAAPYQCESTNAPDPGAPDLCT